MSDEKEAPHLGRETMRVELAAIVCEVGCGLVSDCRSREIVDVLLARYDIRPAALSAPPDTSALDRAYAAVKARIVTDAAGRGASVVNFNSGLETALLEMRRMGAKEE